MAESRRPGRPIDPDCDQRILKATLELLAEIGFDRFRMQDVATRAGVGFNTIYRRWRTKDRLIIDALRTAVTDVRSEDTVDLDGLRRQFLDLADVLQSSQGDFVPGLIAAVRRDPELAEVFRTTWINPRLGALETAVQASAPGLSGDTARLIAELGVGLIIFRTIISGEVVDGSLVQRLIDELLAPLMSERARVDEASASGNGSGGRKPRRTVQRP